VAYLLIKVLERRSENAEFMRSVKMISERSSLVLGDKPLQIMATFNLSRNAV
jgi:hypothetical protein